LTLSHLRASADSKTIAALPKPVPAVRARGLGLGLRVSLLIVVFVILAEVMIYIPAISSFRLSWLKDRLAAANTAALVFAASPQDMIPESLAMEILDSVGSKTIVMKIHGTRRLLAVSDMPVKVDENVDLRDATPLNAIGAACMTLLTGENRVLNVKGPAPMGGDFIEIVLDEAPLQRAMLAASGTILAISALISGLVAILAALALHFMVLRPVRRLTNNVMSFAENPEDIRRIIVPSGAGHEIGGAEIALAEMQSALHHELKHKKHLAALGLAVAKINHDLRNMLASAQLFSDRLALLTDPQARKIGTKLIATLDRAINFCQSTLAYGRSIEATPAPRWLHVNGPLQEAGEALGLSPDSRPRLLIFVAQECEIFADPEHLSRILLNLLRNAAQALRECDEGVSGEIKIESGRGAQSVWLEIADNGPGIPPKKRGGLFQAFQSSARAGGSGLGLSIAAELMQAHGGSIELIERERGACFRLNFPLPLGGKN